MPDDKTRPLIWDNASLDELLDKFVEKGLVEDYIRIVDEILRRHGFKIEGDDESVGS